MVVCGLVQGGSLVLELHQRRLVVVFLLAMHFIIPQLFPQDKAIGGHWLWQSTY